jgi:hypothetical protein
MAARAAVPVVAEVSADGAPGGRVHAGGPREASTRCDLAVAGGYLVAALVLTAGLWSDPSGRQIAGNPHDTDLYTWWLAWTAEQVSHGHLSLITHAMNVPVGVNAMWNTSLLLPGILLAPVTLLAGAQVSYNLLLVAGFAGSGYTAFRLLRRHGGVGLGPSVIGGAVFGFSPAVLHAGVGHVSLASPPSSPYSCRRCSI